MAIPIINVQETGLNIWRLREEAQMTVEELAINIAAPHNSMVYNWQNGRYLPSATYLYRLSKVFGIPMEKILVFWEDAR